MGLKAFSFPLSGLSQDRFLRVDAKYYGFVEETKWRVLGNSQNGDVALKDILIEDEKPFVFQEGEEYKGIPTGQTYIDADGDIIDFQPITSEDHPARLKYLVDNNNILLSSLRLAKSPALFFEAEDLTQYVFSNGFYIFRVRDKYNPKFITYVLRTKKIKDVLDQYIYRGIGISTYKKEDLLKIKIPVVPRNIQDRIVEQASPIEANIKELKLRMRTPQEVINEVLIKAFDLDMEAARALEAQKNYVVRSSYAYRNPNLRSSFRWHKIAPIQDILYKGNANIHKLGDHIVSTNNGWSPTCRETDTKSYVFGVNSISKDGTINFEDLKQTDETKNGIENFYAKNGDLFVSRGNTVNLVALAAVVESLDEGMTIIYPDLFIRVYVDGDINKQYLAYIFNSVIGRLYFKFATKGKNLSMVKVSSEELNNFYLPVPSLEIQEKIIHEIKAGLAEQKQILDAILTQRKRIETAVEEALASI